MKNLRKIAENNTLAGLVASTVLNEYEHSNGETQKELLTRMSNNGINSFSDFDGTEYYQAMFCEYFSEIINMPDLDIHGSDYYNLLDEAMQITATNML